MSRLLLAALDRHWVRHPAQLFLGLLGLALGVALVVGMDLARRQARETLLTGSMGRDGGASHQILGGPDGITAEQVRAVRAAPGWPVLAPVLEEPARLAGRYLTLRGCDPLAEAELRPWLMKAGVERISLTGMLARPGSVLLDRGLAAELALSPGDPLQVTAEGRSLDLYLLAMVDLPAGARHLLLADIATVQDRLGVSRLDRLDVRTEDPETLRRALPPGLSLLDAATVEAQVAGLTAAFEVNLTALSLLALLVGLFLLRGTVALALYQRRPLLAQLRAQGATVRELAGALLVELAVLGAVAALGGALLGRWLAGGLLEGVLATMNDLYGHVDPATAVALRPRDLLLALGLGTAATLLAGAGPLHEALRQPPRQAALRSVLEQNLRRRSMLLIAGAAVAAVGAVWLLALTTGVVAAFAAQGLLLLAGACCCPLLLRLGAAALTPPARLLAGSLGALTLRNLAAGLSRTALAATALTIALAMALAVGGMIASFRSAVSEWLTITLYADIYVLNDQGRLEDTPLPDATVAELLAVPGQARSIINRSWQPAGSLARWSAVDIPAKELPDCFVLLAGEPEQIIQDWSLGAGVLVSEPFSRRNGVAVGDRLSVRADAGVIELRVLGVCRDYGREHGLVYLPRALYEQHWADRRANALAIWAAPGTALDDLAGRLRAAAGSAPVKVLSAEDLRQESLTIFDRTFAVTAVMRQLALVVALVGLIAAFTSLALERRRETAALRRAGCSRRGVLGLLAGEGAALGLISALAALPLGLVLCWLMLDGINLRSFGWSVPLRIDPGELWPLPLAASMVGALAGLIGGIGLVRRTIRDH